MANTIQNLGLEQGKLGAAIALGHDGRTDRAPALEEVAPGEFEMAPIELEENELEASSPCKLGTSSFYASWRPAEEALPHEDLVGQTPEVNIAAQNYNDMAQRLLGHCSVFPEACPPGSVQFLPPTVVFMPVLMPLQQTPAAAPAQFPHQISTTARTTVMWRNLPNNYSRDDLLELLDSQGFAGSYDFFYSPLDFTSNSLMGYAFLNFVSAEEADRFFYHFQGFTQWSLKSDKVCQVTWSQPLQGLEGHIERYRNSAVMHPDVSDDKKPVLFKDGQRIPFPMPTKKIRAPKLKECRPH